MVSKRMLQLGTARSVIRELFEYGNQRAKEVGREMYSPFAFAPILYVTPRNTAGDGWGGVLKYPFDSGT